MYLEPVKPTRRRLSSFCHISKYLVLFDPQVIANCQLRRIDKWDARTFSQSCLHKCPQQHECISLQLHKSVVTEQVRKILLPILTHYFCIKPFQITKPWPMKKNHNTHHFRLRHLTRFDSFSSSIASNCWLNLGSNIRQKSSTSQKIVNLSIEMTP